jgi:predicted  nucleic acid-binding Zn-ribbon protein
MTRSKDLHDLQVLDSKRDKDVRRLREVIVALRGVDSLKLARERGVTAEAELAELERGLRAVEAVRDDLKASVARDEQHLYQGKAMHPKELEGQQMALASHRAQLAARDDEALELLLARDEARTKVEQAAADLQAEEEALAERMAELKRERIQLAHAIKDMEPVLAQARERVRSADLARYDRLRSSSALHGLAVATLEGDVCHGCGQQLPRQEAGRARGQDALVACPGCGRLVHP